MLGSGLQPLHHDVLYRLPRRFHVMAIDPIHGQANGRPVPFGQGAPLVLCLPGRWGRGLYPPLPGGLGSSPHPYSHHFRSIPFNSSNGIMPTYQSFRKTSASTHS